MSFNLKPIELWHGDCLELMKRIPDGSVDMVFADLPYSHLTSSGKMQICTANSWDKPISPDALWPLFFKVAKPTCLFIFTAINPMASILIAGMPKIFKYDLVWQKRWPTGALHARTRPLRAHEMILLFGKGKTTYNPQKESAHRNRKEHRITMGTSNYRTKTQPFVMNNNGMQYPRSVITFGPDAQRFSGKKRTLHPTQKPVALLSWLVQTYTNPGDLILDPCSGSATSAVAAHMTGRRAICIDKSKEYFDIGVDRVKKAMSEPRQAEMAL